MFKNRSTTKHKIAQFRNKSANMHIMLHCSGVKTEKFSEGCGNWIAVPMNLTGSVEELHSSLSPDNWRASFVKVPGQISPIVTVSCTDCWIKLFRVMNSSGEQPADIYEIIKSLDPTGKFHDRLKEKFVFPEDKSVEETADQK